MEEDNLKTEEFAQMKIEVIKMGRFSFELEEKREQSLILQSGHMLTGFSIVSVMLLAAIPIILDYTKIPSHFVFILLGISLLFLILSLLFTIAAQWRYKYLGLDNLDSIFNLMNGKNRTDANEWWLENLNEIYYEKNKLNEKRAKLMKYSTFSFAISIFTILIYLIILLLFIQN